MKKPFTLPNIEPVMPLPWVDFTPRHRTAMLVEILNDDRVPAEVRLEYYDKLVHNLLDPVKITYTKEENK